MRTLALGVSTRGLVESAVRGGYEMVAVDYFGDLDQKRLTETYGLRRDLGLPLSADGLEEAAGRVVAEAVVYCANLENHPEVLDRLQARFALLGNGGDVVRRVRDPRRLREHCRDAGVPFPVTLLPGEESRADPAQRWLVKRVRSGGGHGIRAWRGRRLAPGQFMQEVVDGVPASAVFIADGRASRLLGLTEQILGHRGFGAAGYTWCGNMAPLDLGDRQAVIREQVACIANGLTRRFGLRGINGIDLVVGLAPDGTPRAHLVEVNPRFCASAELLERLLDVNAYDLHLRALAGHLPPSVADPKASCVGKAVVFARTSTVVPDIAGVVGGRLRDIPPVGQRIRAGHPVCTVFATGEDRQSCLDGLLLRAASVYAVIEREGGERRERAIHAGHRTHT